MCFNKNPKSRFQFLFTLEIRISILNRKNAEKSPKFRTRNPVIGRTGVIIQGSPNQLGFE